MPVIITRAALATAIMTAVLTLSGCGAWLDAGPVPEDQWEELFEFEIQPGTMDPAEAEKAVAGSGPVGQVVPGSAIHRGSVTAPSGVVDFFEYRVAGANVGPQPVLCTSTVHGTGSSAGCGGVEPERARQPVQIQGESSGGAWRTADFLVQVDVARLEGTAADGTVYSVVPANGFGYLEWPDDRGSLELVAYNAAGEELGRTFVGLDR